MDKKIRTGTISRIVWFGAINITIILTLMFITQGSINKFIPFLVGYACIIPFVSLLFSIISGGM